jgi:lipopolysaccharide biosynthesis glycosyltransferase
MLSVKEYLPEIPICLCSSEAIGPEDILVVEPDSDVGARRNKLRAYELTPAEWESVLYLDADTEVVGDIRYFFELIEDGWEFVICTDPHLDSAGFLKNRATVRELDETTQKAITLRTTQYNGGVWAFRRGENVRAFFERWLNEWLKYAQRDQGALTRAMYDAPLRVFLLGNEWNTFPRYARGVQSAGLMHYPGAARRWRGMLPGRLDGEAAWRRVRN